MRILGRNNKWLTAKFDLIEEIRKVTIDSTAFNPDHWCENDADILDRAAKMIRREIAEKELVELPTKWPYETSAEEVKHGLARKPLKSLPIAPTPTLRGKEAEKFLQDIFENENVPSYPCGDPEKLEEVRKRVIKDYFERLEQEDKK